MSQVLEAFTVGLLSFATPCLLPLYPAFVAYVAGGVDALRGRRGAPLVGLLVLAGVLVAVALAGVVVTLVAAPLGSVLAVLVPIADVILIGLGVALLLGRNPFATLPGIAVPQARGPYRQAFVYGLVLGPLALPCAGPFLVALLAIALDPADVALRLATFVAFGLGMGLPLAALSFASFARGQALARGIAAHHAVIDRVAGLALIAIGALDLAGWRPAGL